MSKIIRPAYPKEFSIGLLFVIFIVSDFIAFQIFDVHWREIREGTGPFLGMALAGLAVVIMVLIVWEEFLFPVTIRPSADEIVFRNHFTKLKTEVLIYCFIPAIVVYNFMTYEIRYVPFFLWAAICALIPLGKIISGIKNYNDFLKLTNDAIAYKNNEEEGVILVSGIKEIVLIKDESNVLHKVQVDMADNSQTVIDLDEMELENFYDTIEEFIKGHYGKLVR